MKFKGIIFDFNGVLLWDTALHERAWQVTARELRGRELSEDEFAANVHGRPTSHTLAYLAGRSFQGQELLDLIHFKESMYREMCLENADLFVLSPGAEALLDALVAADVPRTIATSSEKISLDFFVHHLGLGKWFDLQQIVYDDGLRPGKPAPDTYVLAAKKIGLPPSECIVVEDAVSGFKSAHAAGIGHIVGLGPRETHARLEACEGVSAVIESFTHFPREILLGAC
jgi:beta-phosphoglucomutase